MPGAETGSVNAGPPLPTHCGPRKVRFQAIDAAEIDDCVGWISADPLLVGSTREQTSHRASFLLSTGDQGVVGGDFDGYYLQLPTTGVHIERLNVGRAAQGRPLSD